MGRGKGAEQDGQNGKSMGSYASLFGDARWRNPRCSACCSASPPSIGLWGIGFFSNKLVASHRRLAAGQNLCLPRRSAGQAMVVCGQSHRSQHGRLLRHDCLQQGRARFGRKPVFAVAFIAAMAATIFFYQCFKTNAPTSG
jgi:hypothetical protein